MRAVQLIEEAVSDSPLFSTQDARRIVPLGFSRPFP